MIMNQPLDNSLSKSVTGKKEDQIMLPSESDTNASLMQSTVLTDLGLIYMLQQCQDAGEGTVMLSSGSLPLLMSSCQVMALHPSVSHQFVSGSSLSSLARSPLFPHDGSVILQSTAAADQLSDKFHEDHQQQESNGSSQFQASSVSGIILTSQHSNKQQQTVNGNIPCYSVVNPASSTNQASVQSKLFVAVPPKTSLSVPKKPLTPYMKFSKSVWQHVKSANPLMSVCEVGASIGRLWREMTDAEKQKYNDEFQQEKAVYETELQNYLQATGLQISDLSRTKKKDPKDRSKSGCTVVVTANQSFSKNILATSPTVSNMSIITTDQNVDGDGARLPHISQMWSDHSDAHHLQISTQNPAVLKAVGSSFDCTQFKAVEHCIGLNENLSGKLGQDMVNLSVEMPSGIPWTWVKAIDQTNLSQSFPMDALDSSQSAIMQQSQVELKVTMTSDAPHTREFSTGNGLEPGEVVVESIEKLSQMNAITNRSSKIISEHNMYNSYASNPWNQYKLISERMNARESIFDREQILKTELIHLHGSLSEKTKEVEQLMKELEMAYKLINKLQNPEEQQILAQETQMAAFEKKDIAIIEKDYCQQNFSEKYQKVIIGRNCGNRQTVSKTLDSELTAEVQESRVSGNLELKEKCLFKSELNKTYSNWCAVPTHLSAMFDTFDVSKINVSKMESNIEKSGNIVIVGHENVHTVEDRIKLSNENISGIESDNEEITKQHSSVDSEHKISRQDVVDQQLDSFTRLQCSENQKDYIMEKPLLTDGLDCKLGKKTFQQMKFHLDVSDLAQLDMKSDEPKLHSSCNKNVVSDAESKDIRQ